MADLIDREPIILACMERIAICDKRIERLREPNSTQLKNFNKLSSTKFFYDAQFNCYRYIITSSGNYILSENDFIEIAIYENNRTFNGECIKIHCWDSWKEKFVNEAEYENMELMAEYRDLIDELINDGIIE